MADHQAQKEIRKHLRQGILEQRRALSPLDALNAGAEIVKVLKDHHYFTEKRMVGSYLSLGGELSTGPINEFLMQNHELALPHMNLKEKGLMDFYAYKKGDPLIENRFHILEPEKLEQNYVSPDKFEALIVPLVAFDLKGNRLGMGGGYYDRMLKKLSYQCLLIGVAYDFQELDSVPIDTWDMPLNEVITPTRHLIF